MKWTNPGHQLDTLGAQYLNVKELFIYGVDEKAHNAFSVLQWLGVADELNVSFVLDITVYNQSSEQTFLGRPVIPLQTTLCDRVHNAPDECAVALPWIAQTNERVMLMEFGLKNLFYLIPSHNRRDNFIQNFVCVWLMYRHGKLLSHWTNFLTTLKCNLNCKYCLNFNEFLKDTRDVTFEEFKDHIDTVFSKFDYVYSIHFCGGEPMVVKELPRFIRYLYDNYGDRIFEFFIITNGTILPSEDTMSAVKAMRGSFLIDDYSASVPNSKVNAIAQVLQARGINYTTNKVDAWFDLDMEHTDNSHFTEEELVYYKDGCNSYLHEFGEKRIYACCYQQYAHRAGLVDTSENDFIEISTASKMEILEFRQGYTKKGYIDFCMHCRGIGGNAKLVSPAIQIPRKHTHQMPQQESFSVEVVSICVPIYNTEKYLVRCIDSLTAQTYQNIEIVLVDDGSTDQSRAICDAYAKQDSRVKVVHQSNAGEAGARNVGLRAATGKYVMFIDSDDEYLPNAVQLLVDAMANDDVDLAIGGYIEKRGDEQHFATGHQRSYLVDEFAMSYLSSDCPYGVPYIGSTINAKLFRKSIIDEHDLRYDERFVIGNDAVFICAYLQHANRIYDIFSPIYIYYKFQPEERVQGMAWYYPDGFFLFAYVADRMIRLTHSDSNAYRKLIEKQYVDFLYALINAITNEDRFQNGVLPYLNAFCPDLDFLQSCATLDLAEGIVRKDDDFLPVRLISELIANKNYQELYDLLKSVARLKQITPYSGTHVRQMIRLNVADFESTASTSGPVLQKRRPAEEHVSASPAVQTAQQVGAQMIIRAYEKLAAQREELTAQKTVIDGQRAEIDRMQDQIDHDQELLSVRAAEIQSCNAEINARNTEIQSCRQEIECYRQSTSWRITKPLRTLSGLLRRK